MMNDVAVDNINRILISEIARGNNVMGLITVDKDNHLNLCWRTNDTTLATAMEEELRAALREVDSHQELVKMPKES